MADSREISNEAVVEVEESETTEDELGKLREQWEREVFL